MHWRRLERTKPPMWRFALFAIPTIAAACSSFSGDPDAAADAGGPVAPSSSSSSGNAVDSGGAADSSTPLDAGTQAPLECDPSWPLPDDGTLVLGLPPGLRAARFSDDELTAIFYIRARPDYQLGTAQRTSRTASFNDNVVTLGPLFNEPGLNQTWPAFSRQGRTLTFSRQDGSDALRVFTAERATADVSFNAPTVLVDGFYGFYSSSGDSLFYAAQRASVGLPEQLVERPNPNGLIGAVQVIHPDAVVAERPTWYEAKPQLLHYIAFDQAKATDSSNYVIHREGNSTWSAPTPEAHPVTWVSPDGCRVYSHDLDRVIGDASKEDYIVVRERKAP